MKRVKMTIGLAILVLGGVLEAQPIEESLNRLRVLTFSAMRNGYADPNMQRRDAFVHVQELVRDSSAAKARVVKEIGDYARKEYPVGPALGQAGKPSVAFMGDSAYTLQLISILATVDRRAFLDVSVDLLGDPRVLSFYKENIFQQVLSTRAAIRMVDPNGLPAYDKGVLTLGMRFLDKEDGVRFTFGDRHDFLSFVRHLVGFSFDSSSLPPIDREKGLEIARGFVADNRFPFVEKEPYMGLLVPFDPQVREEYVGKLREYMDDPKEPKWLRVNCGEKLVKMGELAPQRLEELKKMPQEPNTITHEFNVGRDSQSEKQ